MLSPNLPHYYYTVFHQSGGMAWHVAWHGMLWFCFGEEEEEE